MDLKEKVALITGSSSGIGKSIALALAEKGCVVLVNSRKNVEGGKSVVKQITENSGKAEYLQANLSDEKETLKLFSEIKNKYKSLDILVNCAGESKAGELGDLNLWKYQFENILLSTVNATSEFLKFKTSSLRKIVNISSIYGSPHGGNLEFMAYSAMKAAVNNLTVNLAKKLVPDVLVNAVAPGYTFTPPWGELTQELEKDIKRETRIGRFVSPEEIAQTVLLILQNDALVGQVITVDGGTLLKDLY